VLHHHGGHDHGVGWTLDPVLTVPLALALLVYARRLVRLSRSARRRRPRPGLFLSGWTVLTLSLTSPLHEAGERSFTMHMIEHELIMLVATLLLAASGAGGVLAWGLPRPLRLGARRKLEVAASAGLWKRLTEPVTATVVQAVVMWAWHAPILFDRALDSFGWHIAQHACFFCSSLLFWWAMLHPRGGGGLWRLGRLPVRHLADRRRARAR
jgi:putative membrane protein